MVQATYPSTIAAKLILKMRRIVERFTNLFSQHNFNLAD